MKDSFYYRFLKLMLIAGTLALAILVSSSFFGEASSALLAVPDTAAAKLNTLPMGIGGMITAAIGGVTLGIDGAFIVSGPSRSNCMLL